MKWRECLMAILAYKEQTDKLTKIFDILMHEGLLTYNPKFSKAPAHLQLQAKHQDQVHKKGAVFAVRKKVDFLTEGVKGYIITSKETLLDHANQISHFTPNVYRTFQYSNEKRTMIKGFEEKNLQQINVFVVDIDTQKHSINDILLACIDESVGEPTLILKTDRGYQVYFALATPIYISNHKKHLSLKVAKRIAENVKRSLVSVDADIYCNDFGFFRTPNNQNVVWFNEYAVYEPSKLIDWSQRQDDNRGRLLYVIPSTKAQSSLLTSEWFHQLLQVKDIKGNKGQIGRNNYMFTLALACFQDGQSEDETFNLLDQFNSIQKHPLNTSEINVLIQSAFSGRYNGPKKEYIEQLIALYVPGAMDMPIQLGQKGWYKHKKARSIRERSHLHEWEQDIANYITAEKSVSEPFIWRTQKELCDAVGISSSTLNKLLNQSTKLLKTTTGKGRNAKTGWSTVEHYIAYIIWLKKDLGTRFANHLNTLVEEQLNSLEPVAGYNKLYVYIKEMRRNKLVTVQLCLDDELLSTG